MITIIEFRCVVLMVSHLYNCHPFKKISICIMKTKINWRPPSLSELTPYQISLWLTHLGSAEASKYSNYRIYKPSKIEKKLKQHTISN